MKKRYLDIVTEELSKDEIWKRDISCKLKCDPSDVIKQVKEEFQKILESGLDDSSIRADKKIKVIRFESRIIAYDFFERASEIFRCNLVINDSKVLAHENNVKTCYISLEDGKIRTKLKNDKRNELWTETKDSSEEMRKSSRNETCSKPTDDTVRSPNSPRTKPKTKCENMLNAETKDNDGEPTEPANQVRESLSSEKDSITDKDAEMLDNLISLADQIPPTRKEEIVRMEPTPIKIKTEPTDEVKIEPDERYYDFDQETQNLFKMSEERQKSKLFGKINGKRKRVKEEEVEDEEDEEELEIKRRFNSFRDNIKPLNFRKSSERKLLIQHLDEHLPIEIKTNLERFAENIPKIKKIFETIYAFVQIMEKNCHPNRMRRS